ncbi:MAG: transcriptional regulator [Dermatophilus congolensis]|nr:transcriptional regulator [Dermatophilus congolensis]
MTIRTGARVHPSTNSQPQAPGTALEQRDPGFAEGRTRRTVLRLIAENGPVTAAEVAETLDITPTAVRRHVAALELDGLVVEQEPAATGAPRGRGRPARTYVTTPAAHTRMQTSYDDVANEALRYLAENFGVEAVEGFAQQRAERLLDRYTPIVEAAGDEPAERAKALAEALNNDGFAATARSVEGMSGAGSHGVQLCQGHCPVQSVAAEYGEFCEAEKDAFARLLGVHVQRLSTLATGGHVCTTFVPSPTLRPGAGERQPEPSAAGPPDPIPPSTMTTQRSERTPR